MPANPYHLLLVEDNPGDARIVELLLAGLPALPITLAQAGSLHRALAHLELNPMDAVLLDLGLPDSQGLDTFRRLHEPFPRIPIVLLTGSDDEDLGLQAVQAGAQDYLVKGRIDAMILARTLRYALERQALLEALKACQTEIGNLTRMLPICSYCKKVRDAEGHWEPVEACLSRLSEQGITHGVCPECSRAVLSAQATSP